ncbi:transcription initiation factor IIF, beta subunit [Myxozyma melibiosi]|uniref:Transcription initiation factor IIF, beta subunit n=1 Tax=Myxozyma melibiosi TaxID=54550 RepID=A0ABR1F6T0_9ASCO
MSSVGPTVKPEPVKDEQNFDAAGFEDDEDLSPASVPGEAGDEDEDVYEDSGDLDMSAAGHKVWLVRMPKFLRDRWLEMGSDGRDLGTVRLNNPKDIRLLLADAPEMKDLPHEYKLSVINQKVANTYVFAEENLARFRGSSKDAAADPARDSQGGNGAGSSNGSAYQSKKRRYQPYRRVNIPKKTSIVGTVAHDCSLTVSPFDKNYKSFVEQRQQTFNNTAPRAQVTLLDEIPGVTLAMAGPSMKHSNSMFMKAQKREKERAQEGKAARIPRNELYDLLFKLFEEYDYWSMKGLRERTRQPEAYLKELLESVAILNKKGPYALKYSLRPEYKGRRDAPPPEVNAPAPEATE